MQLFMGAQDSAILRYCTRSNIFSCCSFIPSHLITHVGFPKQLVDSDRNNPVMHGVSVISVQTCYKKKKKSHTLPLPFLLLTILLSHGGEPSQSVITQW